MPTQLAPRIRGEAPPMTIRAEVVTAVDDLLADLEPSLEILEAELLDIEARSFRTETCICTIKCGGGSLSGVSG